MGFGVVGVVGVGLIGGSLGMCLKRDALAARVLGIGRSPARLETAVRLGAIDEAVSLEAAAGVCDWIFCCTPVSHIVHTLSELALMNRRMDQVVTDVGSVKRLICRAGVALGGSFVGGHPMAGAEQAGVESARADLFEAARWAICAVEAPGGDRSAERLAELVRATGAHPVQIDPDTHDAEVARSSHLPHLAAVALALTAAQGPIHGLSAGSLRDGTRVASSSGEIWADILLDNADMVLESTDLLQTHLDALRNVIAARDREAIMHAFDQAHQARKRLGLV